MPPRSPKMKRRILGFQRRVWWPKCTPASSNSRMVTLGTRIPPDRLRMDSGGCAPESLSGHRRRARWNRSAGSEVDRTTLSLTELALRAYPGGRILRAVSGVRVATAADIAACYAISRDLPSDRPTSLDRDLREPERLLLVAEQNDAVIGYGRAALWTVVPDDGRDGYYLTGVSVHPDQRRRGVA